MAKAKKIRPLGDRVIVEAMAQQTSKSGIIIPDTANKEKPQQGKVVAVGPGRLSDAGERLSPEVKEGDVVLFGKYSGTEIEVGSNELLILRESDILAVL
jgi:chaperonin GroES